MRAKDVIQALRQENDVLCAIIEGLREDNRRLTAALLSSRGDAAAAVIVRPRPEKREGDVPTDVRPLGL